MEIVYWNETHSGLTLYLPRTPEYLLSDQGCADGGLFFEVTP
jgi:hypothetical protein